MINVIISRKCDIQPGAQYIFLLLYLMSLFMKKEVIKNSLLQQKTCTMHVYFFQEILINNSFEPNLKEGDLKVDSLSLKFGLCRCDPRPIYKSWQNDSCSHASNYNYRPVAAYEVRHFNTTTF